MRAGETGRAPDDARRMARASRGLVRLGGHRERLELDELAQARLPVLLGIVRARAGEENEVRDALRLLCGLEERARDLRLVLRGTRARVSGARFAGAGADAPCARAG